MLSHAYGSGGSMWQGSSASEVTPPLSPPSPEVLLQPAVKMPSSSFVADYSTADASGPASLKATMVQGDVKLVTTFPQGFSGLGAEKYPSGETYAGGIVHAKRHGVGTYTNTEGKLISQFAKGKPVGEGVLHEKGPKGYSAAVRTYAGKKDGPVSKTHADAIVKNVKSPPKPKKLTPKEWTLSKASPETYVTEAKSQYTYVGPSDPFLDKLAVAETKESPPKKGGVRMDLIPRKADASPTK